MPSIRTAKGRLLWPSYVPADSFWKKLKGIMFLSPSKFSTPLLFTFERLAKSPNSIHSLFCFARFDAVYVDDHKRVVHVIADIGPWKPWIEPRAAVKYLIECPSGQAKRLHVREGDVLSW